MADIIEISRLREARDAAEASERLYEALNLAASEVAANTLCAAGRLRLLSALLPAFAPGLTWELRYVEKPS